MKESLIFFLLLSLRCYFFPKKREISILFVFLQKLNLELFCSFILFFFLSLWSLSFFEFWIILRLEFNFGLNWANLNRRRCGDWRFDHPWGTHRGHWGFLDLNAGWGDTWGFFNTFSHIPRCRHWAGNLARWGLLEGTLQRTPQKKRKEGLGFGIWVCDEGLDAEIGIPYLLGTLTDGHLALLDRTTTLWCLGHLHFWTLSLTFPYFIILYLFF